MRLSTFTLLAAVASASKDSNFYGFTNPNLGKKMYWADAGNVLEDISRFKALFIKFHHCVWSPYLGDDDYDGGGEDGDGWYIGQTQRFRANAAFSLYGVLQSDETTSSDELRMCEKSTYINSFFTEYGAADFSSEFGISDDYATSYCSYEQLNADDDENEENEDNGSGDSDENRLNVADYESTTMGCSNGKFVIDKFRGATCQGHNYLGQAQSLDDYSNTMEAIDCIQVWKSYTGEVEEDAEAYEAGYEGRKLEDGDDDDDSSIAENILAQSSACSTRAYPKDCPDPYHLKKGYEKSLTHASSRANYGLRIAAWTILMIGFVLIAAALFKSWQVSKSKKLEELEERKRKRDRPDTPESPKAKSARLFSRWRKSSKAKQSKNLDKELESEEDAQTLRSNDSADSLIMQQFSDVSASVASVRSSVQESIKSYAESIGGSMKSMDYMRNKSAEITKRADCSSKDAIMNLHDYVDMDCDGTALTGKSSNSNEMVVSADDYVPMSSRTSTSQQQGSTTTTKNGRKSKRLRGRLSQLVFGSRKGKK